MVAAFRAVVPALPFQPTICPSKVSNRRVMAAPSDKTKLPVMLAKTWAVGPPQAAMQTGGGPAIVPARVGMVTTRADGKPVPS